MKEKFFAVQGGVFHVVVSIAYLMAARDIQSGKNLVVFAILAKFIAAVFLLTYYLAWNPIPLVLVSGLGDLAMGALIAFLYRLVRKPVSKSI